MSHTRELQVWYEHSLLPQARSHKWMWVKNGYPKCNRGKWRQGLKPECLWWLVFDPWQNSVRCHVSPGAESTL